MAAWTTKPSDGPPDVDSGIFSAGLGGINTFAPVPNIAGNLAVFGLWFDNTTGAQQLVSVKDANGAAIVTNMPVEPNMPPVVLAIPAMYAAGPLQIACSVASGVNARIWGYGYV